VGRINTEWAVLTVTLCTTLSSLGWTATIEPINHSPACYSRPLLEPFRRPNEDELIFHIVLDETGKILSSPSSPELVEDKLDLLPATPS
jgi:hypothetical protein